MNILVIPEDFRNDQYILKPLFERLVRAMPYVHIFICRDPLLGGIGEALKLEKMKYIVSRYRTSMDAFVLCVDRDGELGRRRRLDQLEQELNNGAPFLAQCAWEEIETWVLAGLDLQSGWSWSDVRAERDVKEIYFERLAAQRGLSKSLGGGRKVLGI